MLTIGWLVTKSDGRRYGAVACSTLERLVRAGLRNVRRCSAEEGLESHTRGPKHVCEINYKLSKLPISKTKENISEQTSRKYALLLL